MLGARICMAEPKYALGEGRLFRAGDRKNIYESLRPGRQSHPNPDRDDIVDRHVHRGVHADPLPALNPSEGHAFRGLVDLAS
jgi:hypothetical protein